LLPHPTIDQLNAMGLYGMAKAFHDITANPDADALSHGEWLALLLDREQALRHDRRLSARLRYAKLRHQAAAEDIDFRADRGLDRRQIQDLLMLKWVDNHENLILEGPTGVGKSWLACAFGHRACRDNRAVLYVRAPKLFDELALAHADGSFARRIKALGTVEVLILDDWGLTPLDTQSRHDLLEIIEDRYGRKSTLVTSQLPVADWHSLIGDPN